MSELRLLTQTAGSSPIDVITAKRAKPDPALFIGSGKVEQIKEVMNSRGIEIAIFNDPLSPAQQRNFRRH
jgi:GTP-binding protein HflX